MGGRGRGSRDADDATEDGDLSAAPSGPSTLFDFLESKLPKGTLFSVYNLMLAVMPMQSYLWCACSVWVGSLGFIVSV